MPDIKNATKLIWRLAILKVVLFSGVSLWNCWSTATFNVDMMQLGAWDWFQTIGGCLASWGLVMMAFIDKSATQISTGHVPGLEDGNDGNENTETKL